MRRLGALLLLIIYALFAWVPGIRCRFLQARFLLHHAEEGNDERIDLDFNLDAWLTAPAQAPIAASLRWEDGRGSVPYPQWDDDAKADLASRFREVYERTESRLISATPPSLRWSADLPASQRGRDAKTFAVYPFDVAWRTFTAYVATSLAMEVAGRVDGRLEEYNDDQRKAILDSRAFYTYAPVRPAGTDPQRSTVPTPGWKIDADLHGDAIPGDPIVVVAFLRRERLLRATSRETLLQVLHWCSGNLRHYNGYEYEGDSRSTPRSFHEYVTYWGHPGPVPVERVLEVRMGRRREAHWTAGCWGTVGFLRAVLRTVNVPVEMERRLTHALPRFMLASDPARDEFLTHGDDLYNPLLFNWPPRPPMPIELLLIDRPQFRRFFETPGVPDHIDSGAKQAAVAERTDGLLRLRCQERRGGRELTTAEALARRFSPAEIVTITRDLDRFLDAHGGCETVPNFYPPGQALEPPPYRPRP